MIASRTIQPHNKDGTLISLYCCVQHLIWFLLLHSVQYVIIFPFPLIAVNAFMAMIMSLLHFSQPPRRSGMSCCNVCVWEPSFGFITCTQKCKLNRSVEAAALYSLPRLLHITWSILSPQKNCAIMPYMKIAFDTMLLAILNMCYLTKNGM